MAPQLTREFKAEAIDFILNKSRQVILEKFDKNNKCNKSIKYVNDILNIEINKNCFPSVGSNSHLPYFEDYRVDFTGTIKNEKIHSLFYLEWKNNDMNTELIPSTTIWNPRNGKCYDRTIKIEKWN